MFYIEKSSFEISAAGSITGRVSINIDDTYFPEKDWNDFVIVILNQWASELRSFILGTSTEAKFLFMEGPFVVKIRSLGSYSQLVLIHNGKDIREVVMHTKKLKSEALKSILSAINLSVQKCSEENWMNKEIDMLATHYDGLKALNTET